MAASLKSVFFACQAAARVMIPQGGGKIINIGSNFGVVAFQGRSVYAAAKAGVHHLSRALSLEWAKQGVTVNVVAPCITETDSRKVILERPGYKEWATTQMLPVGRWNQPDDLVGRRAVPVEPPVRHGRGARPDGRRRLDDPLIPPSLHSHPGAHFDCRRAGSDGLVLLLQDEPDALRCAGGWLTGWIDGCPSCR